jgi:hypothetical protein
MSQFSRGADVLPLRSSIASTSCPSNAHAELRAGHPCRPYHGALAAATSASEGARCGQRAAVQSLSPAPGNGPRVS